MRRSSGLTKVTEMTVSWPSDWRSTSSTALSTASLRGVMGSTSMPRGLSLSVTTNRVPPMLRNWSSTKGRYATGNERK
ncbi:hypothetical protein D3C87_1269520 [compost metagenome]